MRTASLTSRTIVVRGGLLPADFNGRHSSDIPKRYTGARDTTFARSARNNQIPKRDGYIHTYIQTISEMRRRISCLALRRSATKALGNYKKNRTWFEHDKYVKSEIQQSDWTLPNRSLNAKKID